MSDRPEAIAHVQSSVTVAVLGASGRLGRFIVQSLLANGHQVRALIHRRPIEVVQPGVFPVVGDAHDVATVFKLLGGADMVVSTLSSADAVVPDVCSVASANLALAMRELRLSRIVATTGSAAREDREIGLEHPQLAARRAALMPHMSELILDGEEQLRTLARSNLDWTVIRLPRMLIGDRRAVRLGPDPAGTNETVGYQAAASAIVAELMDWAWLGRAPFLVPA